jgi:hypothetical protein
MGSYLAARVGQDVPSHALGVAAHEALRHEPTEGRTQHVDGWQRFRIQDGGQSLDELGNARHWRLGGSDDAKVGLQRFEQQQVHVRRTRAGQTEGARSDRFAR